MQWTELDGRHLGPGHSRIAATRCNGPGAEKLTKRYRWVWPRFIVGGQEKRYLVSFYLPRFLEIDRDEKLATVVHELFHISPDCNGDLRRFPGKNYAHGHSREAYDAALVPVCDQIKRAGRLDEFLLFGHTYRELADRFSTVAGTQYHGLSPRRFNRY